MSGLVQSVGKMLAGTLGGSIVATPVSHTRRKPPCRLSMTCPAALENWFAPLAGENIGDAEMFALAMSPDVRTVYACTTFSDIRAYDYPSLDNPILLRSLAVADVVPLACDEAGNLYWVEPVPPSYNDMGIYRRTPAGVVTGPIGTFPWTMSEYSLGLCVSAGAIYIVSNDSFPTNGRLRRCPLPAGPVAVLAEGVRPQFTGLTSPTVVPTPDGGVWFRSFAVPSQNLVKRWDSRTSTLTVSGPLAVHPNSCAIVPRPDGSVWFAEYTGPQFGPTGHVGRRAIYTGTTITVLDEPCMSDHGEYGWLINCPAWSAKLATVIYTTAGEPSTGPVWHTEAVCT